MSGARRRRRARAGVRRTPEQLRQEPPRRQLSPSQTLLAGAVVVIAVALIALIWITTGREVQDQYQDAEGRVEAAITAQAATLAVQVRQELLAIDQSLAVLQAAWGKDPDTFNLTQWQKTMPALAKVSQDLFIANDHHIIVQDIIPAAVGQGIGSAYATFGTGSLEPVAISDSISDKTMLMEELGDGGVIRQYMMYLVRPLAKPKGWLIGASFQTKALSNVFALAGLGRDGMAALLDTRHGGIQAVAGLAALNPKLALSDTAMYKAMIARPGGGIWIGRTPIDGVTRDIAFRPVPGKHLFVLVGVQRAFALAPAAAWAAGAREAAMLATILILAIAGTVLWEVWNARRNRRRLNSLAQARDMVDSMQAELAALRLRTAADAAQLQAVLGGVDEGVAVFDAEQRLVARNEKFVALCGLGADAVGEDLPLEELLRRQAQSGQFGPIADSDGEVSRRLGLLCPESGVADMSDVAPDGSARLWRVERTREGGLVMLVHGAIPSAAETPALAGSADGAVAAGSDPVAW
jgi:PAS domain-containing protein